MLEILGEPILAILIGVVELLGEAAFDGVLEGLAKLAAEVWKIFAAYCNEICEWIAKVIA